MTEETLVGGDADGRAVDLAAGGLAEAVARTPSPSPATGSAKVHELEQQALLEATLIGL